MNWFALVLLPPVSAAAVAILAKLGLSQIDSTPAVLFLDETLVLKSIVGPPLMIMGAILISA